MTAHRPSYTEREVALTSLTHTLSSITSNSMEHSPPRGSNSSSVKKFAMLHKTLVHFCVHIPPVAIPSASIPYYPALQPPTYSSGLVPSDYMTYIQHTFLSHMHTTCPSHISASPNNLQSASYTATYYDTFTNALLPILLASKSFIKSCSQTPLHH